MTKNLPNYQTLEVPDETPPVEYSTHERRAEVLQLVFRAGSPFEVNQSRLADRYDVHRSTISRDLDRLRESIDEHLGGDAKLTTRALFERTVRELQEADDWRATKAAWDVAMDWNNWLAEVGEQHREPRRSELDVDLESRSREVSYTVVAGDGEELFANGSPDADAEAEARDESAEVGFSSTPVAVDVESTGSDDERGETDE